MKKEEGEELQEGEVEMKGSRTAERKNWKMREIMKEG